MSTHPAIVFEQHRGAASAPLPASYRPRQPERTVLYRATLQHLNTMLAQGRERTSYGTGYPHHVERAFRSYISCGVPQKGFARVKCKACGFEHLVAFSCKSRICPSCHARRMHDCAFHLVDNILPHVGHRQWVLTVPYAIRPLLLRTPKLFSQVNRIFIRALFSYQRRLAAKEGCANAHPAAVVFAQLFGGALNPNPHSHGLLPDGVYVENGPASPLDFLELGPPTQAEVEHLVNKVARKVQNAVETYLEEHGWDTDATEGDAEPEDQLRAQVMSSPPTLSALHHKSLPSRMHAPAVRSRQF